MTATHAPSVSPIRSIRPTRAFGAARSTRSMHSVHGRRTAHVAFACGLVLAWTAVTGPLPCNGDTLGSAVALASSADAQATGTSQKPSPPAKPTTPATTTTPATPTTTRVPERATDPQSQPASPDTGKPAARKPSTPLFHFAGFVEGGYQWFAASDTFDAVLGETGGTVIGGGAVLTHRSGVFFQVDVTRFKADGERVFVYDSQVFPLGIPLSVEMTPIEFTGGYKFFVRPPKPPPPPPPPRKPFFQPARPRPGEQTGAAPKPAAGEPAAPVAAVTPKPRWGGVKPYVGGGVGIVQYKETSEFAGAGDNVDDSFTSFHALGGIDVPILKWLGVLAEVNYRWVPDALGAGGISEEFGENDLGGPSVRVKITIGR